MCTINVFSQSLSQIAVLFHLCIATRAMYATTLAWQPQNPHRTKPRTIHFDLRDRVNTYKARDAIETPPSHDHLSPTDAFFGGGLPNTFAKQEIARPPVARRTQKHRQFQSEPEKPHIEQEQRLSLTALQSHPSPLARELIGKQRGQLADCFGHAVLTRRTKTAL